jgi:hypothetical protein
VLDHQIAVDENGDLAIPGSNLDVVGTSDLKRLTLKLRFGEGIPAAVRGLAMQSDLPCAWTGAAPTGRAGLQRHAPTICVGDAKLQLRVTASHDCDPTDETKIALHEWFVPDCEDPP